MDCCDNNTSLKIIFKETSRCHKPTLHTNNLDDIETLSKVLSFVNDFCLSFNQIWSSESLSLESVNKRMAALSEESLCRASARS